MKNIESKCREFSRSCLARIEFHIEINYPDDFSVEFLDFKIGMRGTLFNTSMQHYSKKTIINEMLLV